MTFFHVGSPGLAVGSVISQSSEKSLASNWPHLVDQERLLEKVRVSEFPGMPKRGGSVFVTNSKEDAEYWAAKIRKSRESSIYKVSVSGGQIVELDAVRLREMRDMISKGNLEVAINIAREYWSSGHSGSKKVPEVLVYGGEVTVKEISGIRTAILTEGIRSALPDYAPSVAPVSSGEAHYSHDVDVADDRYRLITKIRVVPHDVGKYVRMDYSMVALDEDTKDFRRLGEINDHAAGPIILEELRKNPEYKAVYNRLKALPGSKIVEEVFKGVGIPESVQSMARSYFGGEKWPLVRHKAVPTLNQQAYLKVLPLVALDIVQGTKDLASGGQISGFIIDSKKDAPDDDRRKHMYRYLMEKVFKMGLFGITPEYRIEERGSTDYFTFSQPLSVPSKKSAASFTHEDYWSSAHYEVPSDPREMFYDFYALQNMRKTPELYLMTKGGEHLPALKDKMEGWLESVTNTLYSEMFKNMEYMAYARLMGMLWDIRRAESGWYRDFAGLREYKAEMPKDLYKAPPLVQKLFDMAYGKETDFTGHKPNLGARVPVEKCKTVVPPDQVFDAMQQLTAMYKQMATNHLKVEYEADKKKGFEGDIAAWYRKRTVDSGKPRENVSSDDLRGLGNWANIIKVYHDGIGSHALSEKIKFIDLVVSLQHNKGHIFEHFPDSKWLKLGTEDFERVKGMKSVKQFQDHVSPALKEILEETQPKYLQTPPGLDMPETNRWRSAHRESSLRVAISFLQS